MKPKTLSLVAGLLVLDVFASGCNMGRTTKTTLLGTGVGAGVGAIAGGGKGTAIGAGAGALGGFLLGAYEDKHEEHQRDQANATAPPPPPPTTIVEHRYYEVREPVNPAQDDLEYEEYLRWKAERAAPPKP